MFSLSPTGAETQAKPNTRFPLRFGVLLCIHFKFKECSTSRVLTFVLLKVINKTPRLYQARLCFVGSALISEVRPGYYFHVNGSIGIVQKIDFEIRPDLGCTTPKTSRKVALDNPSVCLSVCFWFRWQGAPQTAVAPLSPCMKRRFYHSRSGIKLGHDRLG